MQRILEDVGTYLNTWGIGTVGTNMFIANMPPSPTKCLSIFSNGGLMSPQNAPYYNPQFQILIRDTAYNVIALGRLADYVFSLLDNKWEVFTRFKGRITALSPPGVNYKDETGNWVYSLNFQAIVTQTDISSPYTL